MQGLKYNIIILPLIVVGVSIASYFFRLETLKCRNSAQAKFELCKKNPEQCKREAVSDYFKCKNKIFVLGD